MSTSVSHNIYPTCTGIDVTIPSTPTNLAVSQLTSTSLSLNWSTSTDNYAVAYYEIYQNGVKIGTSQTTPFSLTGLQTGTNYVFTIKAKDASENSSLASVSVSVVTPTTQDETIYGDALNPNWQNVSSISSLNMANTNPQFINTKSIKVTNPTLNETLDFRKNTSLNTTSFPYGIDFWVYNEGSSSFPFQVQSFETSTTGGSTMVSLAALPQKWTHHTVSWAALGNPPQVGKVLIKLNQSQAESLYFDEIKLLFCNNMQTVKTGNWSDTSVWSCGRVPVATDAVKINLGHTVTLLNGQSGTLNLLNLLGTLNQEAGSILTINNY